VLDILRKRFSEARIHAHRKDVVDLFLPIIDSIIESCTQWNFESIYALLKTKKINQIGPLTLYDITVQICKERGIPIQRVYLAGNGPYNAVTKLLTMPMKKCSVTRLNYVTISDVREVFRKKGFRLSMLNSENGNDYESALCYYWKERTSDRPKVC